MSPTLRRKSRAPHDCWFRGRIQSCFLDFWNRERLFFSFSSQWVATAAAGRHRSSRATQESKEAPRGERHGNRADHHDAKDGKRRNRRANKKNKENQNGSRACRSAPWERTFRSFSDSPFDRLGRRLVWPGGYSTQGSSAWLKIK